MKYAIVLPAGAADEPVRRLEGRTPLEVAAKPHIDWISTNGRQGRIMTIPDGFSRGSDVAMMSLLGYDPRVNHDGHAPLEAAARGISVESDELIFRCNFVTITDGMMEDFTAGCLPQPEASRLISDLNEQVATRGTRFYTGVSYRNLLIASDAADFAPKCTPPHDIPDRPVAEYLPRGPGADRLKDLMQRAHAMLADHDVNLVRRDLGENPATDIWLWGQGRPRGFESFASRFGVSGAVIAAVDLVCGLARSVGMETIDVPGATGFLDTDYVAKGRAAVEALDSFDLVIVHVAAPDEAGHLGDADAKITAIERVDEHIVGPLLDKLSEHDQWKIMIAPSHATPVGRRAHTLTPTPFCIAGDAIHTVLNQPFSEVMAAKSDLQIDPGHDLMEYFLRP